MSQALVIGAGPAGLMAANVLADAGHDVIVAEAKPSPARKFLMAGKSGLNLTKSEEAAQFLAAYGPSTQDLSPMLANFGAEDVRAWAENLDQPLFTGSTGRVFPIAMKASPLLRAWLARLRDAGVDLRVRWRWNGWDGEALAFDTPEGQQRLTPDVTVLACGGASWSRLGSDGAWVDHLPPEATVPFAPSNMGVTVDWSDHMQRHFGQPVKGIALRCGDATSRGEIAITQQGLEGGGLYEVSRGTRDGCPLLIDLLPDLSHDQIRARLAKPRGKASLSNHLRKVLKLSPAKQALLMEFGRPLPDDLETRIKSLPIAHTGADAMDKAISTTGGLAFAALDNTLMLRDRPGVFAAGEMLDWDAPTGGYLITACLATGRWAGLAAAKWLTTQSAS